MALLWIPIPAGSLNMKICHVCSSVYACATWVNVCGYSVPSLCSRGHKRSGPQLWKEQGRKGSGGKGVTGACQPSHPKPLPQGAIKHTRDSFALRHWYTHINRQSIMTELTISGCFDPLVKCHVTEENRSLLLMTVDGDYGSKTTTVSL